jgi:hypothetical protein
MDTNEKESPKQKNSANMSRLQNSNNLSRDLNHVLNDNYSPRSASRSKSPDDEIKKIETLRPQQIQKNIDFVDNAFTQPISP